MARRGDRTCFVCRNGYKYCPTCGGDDPKETWRFLFCSDNCRKIEHIWEDCFRDKNCSTEDAAIRLMDQDISRLDMYRDQIRDDITELAVIAGMIDVEEPDSEIEDNESSEEDGYEENIIDALEGDEEYEEFENDEDDIVDTSENPESWE